DASRRRTSAELPKLLAGLVELLLGAESREDLVRAAQLARRALAITGARQRDRELAPEARRVRHVGDRLARFRRAAQLLQRSLRLPDQQLADRGARIRPREAESLTERGGLPAQARRERSRPFVIGGPQRGFGDDRHEPVNRPHHVARLIGDLETALADLD